MHHLNIGTYCSRYTGVLVWAISYVKSSVKSFKGISLHFGQKPRHEKKIREKIIRSRRQIVLALRFYLLS